MGGRPVKYTPKGTRFGFYVTTGVGPIPIGGNNHWQVQCVCGTIKLCKAANLHSGRSKSCGCSAGDTISLKAISRLNPLTGTASGPRRHREIAGPVAPKPPAPEPVDISPAMKTALAMRKTFAKWAEVFEVTGLTRDEIEAFQQ
jgi:hypothetical protein